MSLEAMRIQGPIHWHPSVLFRLELSTLASLASTAPEKVLELHALHLKEIEWKGQAEKDLRIKRRLERTLHRKLRALDREIAQAFTETLARTGAIIDMESRALQPLTNILRSHYFETGAKFDSVIRKALPVDVAITATEETVISEALSQHFNVKADQQARLILRTHQKNAIEAVNLGREVAAAEAITGTEEVARISGSILDRKLVGREGGISTLETLHPAEASKATEFEVLSGSDQLSVLGQTPNVETHKVWTNQGDHVVRGAGSGDDFNHIVADEQKVLGGEPFLVSGENLWFPGDTSLGASVGNVVNCRCATRHDTKEIIEARRRAA